MNITARAQISGATHVPHLSTREHRGVEVVQFHAGQRTRKILEWATVDHVRAMQIMRQTIGYYCAHSHPHIPDIDGIRVKLFGDLDSVIRAKFPKLSPELRRSHIKPLLDAYEARRKNMKQRFLGIPVLYHHLIAMEDMNMTISIGDDALLLDLKPYTRAFVRWYWKKESLDFDACHLIGLSYAGVSLTKSTLQDMERKLWPKLYGIIMK